MYVPLTKGTCYGQQLSMTKSHQYSGGHGSKGCSPHIPKAVAWSSGPGSKGPGALTGDKSRRRVLPRLCPGYLSTHVCP